MLSVERILRWRPPDFFNSTEEDDVDDSDGELLDVDSSDEDSLDEDEDVREFFVLSPTVAMFLMRMVDRAAPQSMKAKVAPFHNFILECRGALKLCEESKREAKGTTSDMLKQSHLHSCKPSSPLVTLLSFLSSHFCDVNKSTSLNWDFSCRAVILPPVYSFWFCCQLIFTPNGFVICEPDITCSHLRMQSVIKVVTLQPGEEKHDCNFLFEPTKS